MSQRLGTLLLSLAFIGLGVMYCAYPNEVVLKSIKFYSGFVPILASLKVNVVVGAGMLLTATSLLLNKSHSALLVQTLLLCALVLEGIPYVSTYDQKEQFRAAINAMKFIGITGGSLLIAKN